MSKVKAGGIGRCYIICFALCSVIILGISMIMAAVALATKDPTSLIGIFSLSALVLSAAGGGFITAKLNPTEKIGFPLTVCLGLTMVMLLIGVITSGGHTSLGALMNYLCYFGIFALLSYLGGRGGKRHNRKRLK